jgi:hypothetical protein
MSCLMKPMRYWQSCRGKMMADNRCGSCEHWEETGSMNQLRTGSCTSGCTPRCGVCGGFVVVPIDYSCCYWQKRELPLRERLARYVYYYVRCGVKPYSEIDIAARNSYLGHADRILTFMRGQETELVCKYYDEEKGCPYVASCNSLNWCCHTGGPNENRRHTE